MNERRFLNQHQPQTLVIATLLLYFNAALLALFGGFLIPKWLLLIVLFAVGAYGIANEKRWGYVIGIVAAVLHLLVSVQAGIGNNIINVIFAAALVALLLHPMSRDYQRIWFK